MNPASVVEEVLGDALAPELLLKVERMPRKKLVELHERYTAYSEQFRLPEKPPAVLRPYVSHAVAEHLGLDELYLDPKFSCTRSAADNVVKQHLLYAHELVMHDPLPYHLDFFAEPEGRGDDAPHRARLAQYLGFLMQVRPLLDAGVLFFIDDAPYRIPWLQKHASWPPTVPELDGLAEAAEDGAVLLDVEGAKSTFLASAHHAGNLDLYLSRNESLRALSGALESVGQGARPSEVSVLNRLLTVNLPRVDDLSLADVIALRRSEDTLESWRQGVLPQPERDGPDPVVRTRGGVRRCRSAPVVSTRASRRPPS